MEESLSRIVFVCQFDGGCLVVFGIKENAWAPERLVEMFALWIAFVCAAVVSAKGAVYNNASPENAFKECLVSQSSGSLGYCIGYGALAKLRSFDTSPEFDLVDGLTFTRDEKMYRDGYSVVSESDPGDFR